MIINSKCLLCIYTLFSLATLNTSLCVFGASDSANTPKITQKDLDALKAKVNMATKAWNDHLNELNKAAKNSDVKKSDWHKKEDELYKAIGSAGEKFATASRHFNNANPKALVDQSTNKLDGDKESESENK